MQFDRLKRREFITLLSGAAASWPVAARAQQGERLRLVGVLEGVSADTPNAKARPTAFLEGLQQSGWMPGRNVRVEVRWGGGDQAAIQKDAAELVALAPDVLVAGGSAAAELVLSFFFTIPIVFVIVPDPVGSGFVESLSRPGANATGFMMFDWELVRKVVGAAQRDCAERNARGSPPGCWHCCGKSASSRSSNLWRQRSASM